MSDKLKKNRLVEANVTEISFVPDGAVEDAEYMVLRKELDESADDLKKEDAVLDEVPVKDAFDIMLRRLDELEDADKQSLAEALGVQINSVDQEPGSSTDSGDTQEAEASADPDEPGENEIEKEHTPEPSIADLQKKVDGILSVLEKLDIKHTSDQPATEDLEKEELPEEDPIEAAVRILAEKEALAKEQAASNSTNKILEAVSKVADRLESVSDKFADSERRLARACGQDA